jgi:hypothetical protein
MVNSELQEMFMRTPLAPLMELSSSKRMGNGFFRRLYGAVVAARHTDSHYGHTRLGHDRFHVGKIQIDQSGIHDQVRNTL